jgi:GNAT superfamily N-acetyltransferase
VALKLNHDEPIGGAWLRLWDPNDPGYGYCDAATPELSIAVLPQHRGKGVGTRLLERLLDVASAYHRDVSLSVSIDNPARRLYQRMGFVVVQQCEHSLIMRRAI